MNITRYIQLVCMVKKRLGEKFWKDTAGLPGGKSPKGLPETQNGSNNPKDQYFDLTDPSQGLS